MREQAENLYLRTGAITFGFVTRGGVNCTGQAGFFVGGPAAEFCSVQLGFTMWDLVALFELGDSTRLE